MTNTHNDIHDRIAQIENDRIEASLDYVLGSVEHVEQIIGDDGKLTGWKVLGDVVIERDLLPVDFAGDTEIEPCADHRLDILFAIEAAYRTGRRVGAESSTRTAPSDLPQDIAGIVDRFHSEFASELKVALATLTLRIAELEVEKIKTELDRRRSEAAAAFESNSANGRASR